MTIAPTSPTQAVAVSNYPVYAQAKAYLKKFFKRGKRTPRRTRRYAFYEHSLGVDVIVIRVVDDIYEVRAYPFAAYYVASVEEAQAVQPFRGWLFARDSRTRSIVYIAGSQRLGIPLYKLVKKAIRHEGTLARGNSYYRKLV